MLDNLSSFSPSLFGEPGFEPGLRVWLCSCYLDLELALVEQQIVQPLGGSLIIVGIYLPRDDKEMIHHTSRPNTEAGANVDEPEVVTVPERRDPQLRLILFTILSNGIYVVDHGVVLSTPGLRVLNSCGVKEVGYLRTEQSESSLDTPGFPSRSSGFRGLRPASSPFCPFPLPAK